MPDYSQFSFKKTAQDKNSKARCGLLTTPNGTIETPNFIFCGTKGALKGVTTQQAKDAGAEIILANTYHLLVNPGPDAVARMGGLHKMMQWQGPMLTDSGGFQIFSLGHGGVADEIKGRNRYQGTKSLLKIKEDGAVFRSYHDGKFHHLTPEYSIQIQQKINLSAYLRNTYVVYIFIQDYNRFLFYFNFLQLFQNGYQFFFFIQ